MVHGLLIADYVFFVLVYELFKDEEFSLVLREVNEFLVHLVVVVFDSLYVFDADFGDLA